MEATRVCCGGGDECTSSWHHWHAGAFSHHGKSSFFLLERRFVPEFSSQEKVGPRISSAHEVQRVTDDAWSWVSLSVLILSFHLSTHFTPTNYLSIKMTWYIKCHKWVTFHLSTTCAHQPTHLLRFRTLSCASLSSIASATVVALFLIFTVRTMKLSIALLSLTAGASAFTAAPLQTRWVYYNLCPKILFFLASGNFSGCVDASSSSLAGNWWQISG